MFNSLMALVSKSLSSPPFDLVQNCLLHSSSYMYQQYQNNQRKLYATEVILHNSMQIELEKKLNDSSQLIFLVKSLTPKVSSHYMPCILMTCMDDVVRIFNSNTYLSSKTCYKDGTIVPIPENNSERLTSSQMMTFLNYFIFLMNFQHILRQHILRQYS